MSALLHRRPTHPLHAFKCSGNATILPHTTLPACLHSMAVNPRRLHPINAPPQDHHHHHPPLLHHHTQLLPTLLISLSQNRPSSPNMASAVVCSSRLQSCAAQSRIWTSDVPKQDFSGNRLVAMRRSPVINAAVRSSSEGSTDFQGRYSSACIDQPCALSCPIIRDTNVERWVEESVHEIVRNIQEAPFLQYIFDSASRFRRSQRQKLLQEYFEDSTYWPSIRDSLSKVDPDGVILVQKLEPGCAATCYLAEAFGDEEMVCPLQAEGAETNVWGVFVQARGLRTNACYLLKTTRVCSPGGACTRYCLTRATCFGPSQVEQLESAWLL